MESDNSSLSKSLEDNLHHAVVSTLHQTGYFQHQTLDITVDHGTVIVEGRVPTWYLRQIALECIKRVTGVVGVVDRIRVVRESQDENAPYFSPAVVQPATETGKLEVEACPTICVPVTECLAAPVLSSKFSSNDGVEDEHESPHPWFEPQLEVPDEERQLQTICGQLDSASFCGNGAVPCW